MNEKAAYTLSLSQSYSSVPWSGGSNRTKDKPMLATVASAGPHGWPPPPTALPTSIASVARGSGKTCAMYPWLNIPAAPTPTSDPRTAHTRAEIRAPPRYRASACPPINLRHATAIG